MIQTNERDSTPRNGRVPEAGDSSRTEYEDLIIDGHHRYIASIISKTKISQIYSLKPTTIHVYPWEEIEFVD